MDRAEYESALKDLATHLEPDAMSQGRIDFTWDLHHAWLAKLHISALNAVLARFAKQSHYNSTAGGLESAIEALAHPTPKEAPTPHIPYDATCCDRGLIFKYQGSAQYIFRCITHSMGAQSFPLWMGQTDYLDFPHCKHNIHLKEKCEKCEHTRKPPEASHGHFQDKSHPF